MPRRPPYSSAARLLAALVAAWSCAQSVTARQAAAAEPLVVARVAGAPSPLSDGELVAGLSALGSGVVNVLPTKTLREARRAVRDGRAVLAELPLPLLERESGLFAAASIPFLALGEAAVRRQLDILRPYLARRLAEDDLSLIALLPGPRRGLFARRSIADASALAGGTFAAPDAVTRRLAELMGAKPVAVAGIGSAAQSAGPAPASAPPAARAATGPRTLDRGRQPDIAAHAPDVIPAPDVVLAPADEAADVAAAAGDQATYHDLAVWLGASLVVADRRKADDRAGATGRTLEQTAWRALAARHHSALRRVAERGIAVVEPPPALAAGLAATGARLADEWMPGAGADGAAYLGALRSAP